MAGICARFSPMPCRWTGARRFAAWSGFCNKAKMAVGGGVERPLLGMLHRDGALKTCSPIARSIRHQACSLSSLRSPFIARAGLLHVFLIIAHRRRVGEPKHISADRKAGLDGGMMLRFVSAFGRPLVLLAAAAGAPRAARRRLKSDYRQYSAGAYGPSWKERGNFSSPTSRRWRENPLTACRWRDPPGKAFRPTRRWPAGM